MVEVTRLADSPAVSSTRLDYYAGHSLMTDPRRHADLFNGLPTDVPGLVRVVQGLLLHPLTVQLYHVQLSAHQRDEVQLRSVHQMLGRIRELDPAPLTIPREPAQRLIGNCRDHAVLYIALLRQQGIPARLRVGFATYFSGRMNHDHWIVEYWDERQGRWVLIDPQIDAVQRRASNITFDTLNMRFINHFYLAGQAWDHCRAGQARSVDFGFNNKWKGLPFIRGNLLHDLEALNKIELLPWDFWSDFSRKREQEWTQDDRQLLDRLAELTVNADAHFDELRAIYDELPHSQEVRSRLDLLGLTDRLTFTDPDALQAAANPLAAFQQPPAEVEVEYVPYNLPDHFAANGQPAAPNSPLQAGLMTDIVIHGARQHNLKHINIRIPRHRLVVITGVSGSGKSSLAFDTLYAEGQRRYVESLSSYARQFLGQMEKPQVDYIGGLSPAIAIEQKTVSKNPRSTVGTVTEIVDYLRVLYARVGTPHCPQCGRAVQPQTAHQITAQLLQLKPGTRFQLLAPMVRGRKGTHADKLAQAHKSGYTRARINGEMVELVDARKQKLDKNKKHTIELIVDRLAVPPVGSDQTIIDEFHVRLADSVETTLRAGEGMLVVDLGEGQSITLSEHNACPDCDLSFAELNPHLFSFNSPYGMCPECNGLGVQLQVDPDLIVTKPHLSLLDGASPWYGNIRKKGHSKNWIGDLDTLAEHYGVDLELPWKELPAHFRQVILYGSGDEQIRFSHRHESDSGTFSGESVRSTKGIVYHVNRLFRQTKSEWSRRHYAQYMSQQPCPVCQGERLCAEARFVEIDAIRFPKVTAMTIADTHRWVVELPAKLSAEQFHIAEEILKELHSRLQFLLNVGLHYLSLDRPAPTLSGGEGQRIRLASQLGCGLVGVLYILDEPSIGLHVRDHRALLKTLTQLRDMGNTVLVVEHDADTMRDADWIIDLGPGAGILGGEVVAAGTPQSVMADPQSLTGRYLSGVQAITAPNDQQRREPNGWLTVVGARLHNLKNLDVRFPLGVFTCITGVSGSGKSSLISHTLHPALSRALHNAQTVPGPHERIDGLEHLDKIINITQDPIGRTPRSNPATYVGLFDEIRRVFAGLPDARALGYKADRFSFNVKGGRCEACQGHGVKRVEMHFLADLWVTCQECGGRRFNRQTLNIRYKDRSIADVLDMDVQEALDFFANHPKISRILQTLHDVGLDYVKLGQSALTLSGGEAQRVKLAKELSRVDTGRTLYILDEPTTGLHFADIQRLLDVLHRLVDAGNSVVVIEHNLDIIKTADWLIDLGPEGGDGGGQVVAEGTPEAVTQVEASHTGRFLQSVLKE